MEKYYVTEMIPMQPMTAVQTMDVYAEMTAIAAQIDSAKLVLTLIPVSINVKHASATLVKTQIPMNASVIMDITTTKQQILVTFVIHPVKTVLISKTTQRRAVPFASQASINRKDVTLVWTSVLQARCKVKRMASLYV
jgi:hypothetical protein